MASSEHRGRVPRAGRDVCLRPLRAEDLATVRAWLADPDVRAAFTGGLGDLGAAPPASLAWGVWIRAGGGPRRLFGWAELADLDRRAGRAELRICLGRKELWGLGYGTEAVRLVLGRAFRSLGLAEVYLRVTPDNRRAIRAYQKCGFVVEGLLRAGRHAALGLSDHLLMTATPPGRLALDRRRAPR
ncbi:MAG: GNAT family N-acetyltransferase [Clostridia bacterium]|nr:GNAT family N-acetyltransferase [Clostridia bacterium]